MKIEASPFRSATGKLYYWISSCPFLSTEVRAFLGASVGTWHAILWNTRAVTNRRSILPTNTSISRLDSLWYSPTCRGFYISKIAVGMAWFMFLILREESSFRPLCYDLSMPQSELFKLLLIKKTQYVQRFLFFRSTCNTSLVILTLLWHATIGYSSFPTTS